MSTRKEIAEQEWFDYLVDLTRRHAARWGIPWNIAWRHVNAVSITTVKARDDYRDREFDLPVNKSPLHQSPRRQR